MKKVWGRLALIKYPRTAMKKFIIAVLLLLTSVSRVIAQEEDGKKYEKIRAIKVTYITEKVHMSAEQSAKFWPVYDAYQNERRDARRESVQQYLSAHPGATKEQARASLEGNLDYQGAELELKKKYKDRLLQIISAQQLDQLYQAERQFKVDLMKQLKDNN